MANVKLIIDNRFHDKSIKEVLEYFHLGKEKSKKVTFILNEKVVSNDKRLHLGDVLVLEYQDEIDHWYWLDNGSYYSLFSGECSSYLLYKSKYKYKQNF